MSKHVKNERRMVCGGIALQQKASLDVWQWNFMGECGIEWPQLLAARLHVLFYRALDLELLDLLLPKR